MRRLETREQLRDALATEAAVFYKHSGRCVICMRALRQVRRYAAGEDVMPVFLIDVLEQRELSDDLARHLGVVHETPQVIVTKGGRAEWDTSHFGISAGRLRSHT